MKKVRRNRLLHMESSIKKYIQKRDNTESSKEQIGIGLGYAAPFNVPSTWDTTTDNRIMELHPSIRATAANFINTLQSNYGMKVRIYSGFRSFAAQDELYAKGRTTPGSIVTNAEGGESYHNYGLAFDVVEIEPNYGFGNGYDSDRWNTIGDVGKAAGFEWGGDWTSFVDKPHFQMTSGFSTAQLLAKHNQQDFISGTSFVALTGVSTGQSHDEGHGHGESTCGGEHRFVKGMGYSHAHSQPPISAHISYREATYSQTAINNNLSNNPGHAELANMKVLAEKVFEPIRNHFNQPIYISSFFRTKAVNAKIPGSSKTSDHINGRSMDIDMDGRSGPTNAEVFYYIKNNLEFDQLIWEKGTNTNPNWVHVSYREGNNRNEVLRLKNGVYSAFSLGDYTSAYAVNEMSTRGITFLKDTEGFRTDVYDDGGGYPTIGYGHKLSSTEVKAYHKGTYKYQNGITKTQAEQLLKDDLESKAYAPMRRFLKVSLTQQQFDATASYVFNAGPGNTLSRKFGKYLNEKKWSAAAKEMDIVTSGGVKMAGLVKRRNAEYDMFMNGVYGNKDDYNGTSLSFGISESYGRDPYPRIKSSKFKSFLPTILAHEGGYVNDPDDPGGETNKGITMRTFKRYAKSILGKEPTSANLKKITDEEAGMIYEQIYWKKLMAEQIKDVQVAQQYVDFYINAGSNAIRTMQRALNALGQNVAVDGGMGPKTLAAINAVDGEKLFNMFRKKRQDFYDDLVKRKPKMKKFLKGWTKRTNSFVYKK